VQNSIKQPAKAAWFGFMVGLSYVKKKLKIKNQLLPFHIGKAGAISALIRVVLFSLALLKMCVFRRICAV